MWHAPGRFDELPRGAPDRTLCAGQLGKRQGEDTAPARKVEHLQRAAHHSGAGAADAEPQAQAAPIDSALLKGVKQLLDLARRQAATFVLYRHENSIIQLPNRE